MEQYQPELADLNNYVVVDEMRFVLHPAFTKFVNLRGPTNKIAFMWKSIQIGFVFASTVVENRTQSQIVFVMTSFGVQFSNT
jgi:hypothetical protein